jgi:hypothetical protein
VRVAHHKTNSVKTTPHKASQEVPPQDEPFSRTDHEAQDFTIAVHANSHRDQNGQADHPALAADLLVTRVHEDVREFALQRPLFEDPHFVLNPFAQPRNEALVQVIDVHLLAQSLHAARRHSLHVGLLDDTDQRLLGSSTRFQERLEIRALTQLRDVQDDVADPGRPLSIPVAVAVRVALNFPFAVAGSHDCAHICLHHLMHDLN